KRHIPWPSYHSSLTRSPRLPRKANKAPECGFLCNTCCAITARPLKPLRMSVAPQARYIRVEGDGGIIGPVRRLPVQVHRYRSRRPPLASHLKEARSRSGRSSARELKQPEAKTPIRRPRQKTVMPSASFPSTHLTSHV